MLSSFVFIVNSCMYYVLSIVSIFLIYIYVTGSEKRGNIALTIDSELTIPS